jgi:hypothetical protein
MSASVHDITHFFYFLVHSVLIFLTILLYIIVVVVVVILCALYSLGVVCIVLCAVFCLSVVCYLRVVSYCRTTANRAGAIGHLLTDVRSDCLTPLQENKKKRGGETRMNVDQNVVVLLLHVQEAPTLSRERSNDSCSFSELEARQAQEESSSS